MREGERDHKHRGRVEGEADFLLSRKTTVGLHVGLNPETMESCPELKADAKLSHPGTLQIMHFKLQNKNSPNICALVFTNYKFTR